MLLFALICTLIWSYRPWHRAPDHCLRTLSRRRFLTALLDTSPSDGMVGLGDSRPSGLWSKAQDQVTFTSSDLCISDLVFAREDC